MSMLIHSRPWLSRGLLPLLALLVLSSAPAYGQCMKGQGRGGSSAQQMFLPQNPLQQQYLTQLQTGFPTSNSLTSSLQQQQQYALQQYALFQMLQQQQQYAALQAALQQQQQYATLLNALRQQQSQGTTQTSALSGR